MADEVQLSDDRLRWIRRPVGPVLARIDGDRALAYGAATNDLNPLYEAGTAVPPVFVVAATWDVLVGLVGELVDPALHARLIHASQDLHFHRPLEVGESLSTVGTPHGLRRTKSGSTFSLRITSSDTTGEVVVDQYATLFLRRVRGTDEHGDEPPGHGFAPNPGDPPQATWTGPIDADQTSRYRAASGDENPIHTDHDAARAAGLPGIVVHGLCTMAMCARAVTEVHGGGDPRRLARLAVSFSWPVFPDSDLVVETFPGSGPGDVRFHARSAGKTVIRDGLAVLHAAVPEGSPPL